MNVVEILEQKLQEKYMMKGEVSFIVMNKDTAQSIVSGFFNLDNGGFLFTTYKGIEVLISESLEDNEFRIG